MWLFMVDRPKGVTLVAVLTFLSSGALAFWFLLSIVLGFGVGAEDNPPIPFANFLWSLLVGGYLNPLFLSIFAFVLSIAVFLGRRFAWYGSIVLWILLLAYFGLFAVRIYSQMGFTQGYEFQIALAALVPLIYAGACLLYFQTVRVKEYFGV